MSQNIPAIVKEIKHYKALVVPTITLPANKAHIQVGMWIQCQDLEVGDTGNMFYWSGVSYGQWCFAKE